MALNLLTLDLDNATHSNTVIAPSAGPLPRRIVPFPNVSRYWRFGEVGATSVVDEIYGATINLVNVAWVTGPPPQSPYPYAISIAGLGSYGQASAWSEKTATILGRPISYSFWFRNTQAQTSYARFISTENPATGTGMDVFLLDDGQIGVQILGSGSAVYQLITPPVNVNVDSNWHHLAFTWTGGLTHDTLRVYFDGTYYLGTTATPGLDGSPTDDGATPLQIGRLSNGISPWPGGELTGLIVFPKVLSDGEVAILATQVEPTIENCIVSWAVKTAGVGGETLRLVSVPGSMLPIATSLEVFVGGISQGTFKESDLLSIPVVEGAQYSISLTLDPMTDSYIGSTAEDGPHVVYEDAIPGGTPLTITSVEMTANDRLQITTNQTINEPLPAVVPGPGTITLDSISLLDSDTMEVVLVPPTPPALTVTAIEATGSAIEISTSQDITLPLPAVVAGPGPIQAGTASLADPNTLSVTLTSQDPEVVISSVTMTADNELQIVTDLDINATLPAVVPGSGTVSLDAISLVNTNTLQVDVSQNDPPAPVVDLEGSTV